LFREEDFIINDKASIQLLDLNLLPEKFAVAQLPKTPLEMELNL